MKRPILPIGSITMTLAVCGCSNTTSNAPAASNNPGKSPQTIQVEAYQIDGEILQADGETFLPPDKLPGTLMENTGTVDVPRLSMEVKEVQEVYRQAGFTNVRVVLPMQRLTNGIIHLKAVVIDGKV